MKKIFTVEQFIEKAQAVHGIHYDYSKVNYTGSKNKIIIICPIHGEFLQTPSDHLKGAGCPRCKAEKIGRLRKSNINNFIEQAKLIHGNNCDYSNFVYINSRTKGRISCLVNKFHLDFYQTPNNHLNGRGCPDCKKDKLSKINKLSINDIVTRSKNIHGNVFNYDNLIRVGNKITLYCNNCKKNIIQNLHDHLQGYGCLTCSYINNGYKFRHSQEDIIVKFIKIHGNYYNYDQLLYTGIDNKVIIICPIHGEFKQTPYLHMKGYGCPKCSSSKGEKSLIKIFQKNNISFHHQYKLPIYNYRYDFYLPCYNLLIEFHGGQHFKPVKWFGGEEGFLKNKERDSIKKSLAREYKIPIIYFTYKHFRMPKEQFEKFVISVIDKVRRK